MIGHRGATLEELEALYRRLFDVFVRVAASVTGDSEHGVGAIVRATHERWDGTGYIDGLAGDAIPLAARIIAVCDTFTAMTSDRPYGEAVSVDEALAELRGCAGTQFDPEVVRVFCEVAVRTEGNDLVVADAA